MGIASASCGSSPDALLWNYWPKMTSTPGGVPATIDFRLFENGRRIAVPGSAHASTAFADSSKRWIVYAVIR